MTYSDENLFTTTPSFWIIVPVFILSLLLTFFKFPFLLLYTAYKIVELWCWDYLVNERTIIEKKGIFSVSYREIHYSRIKSIMVDQPFILRIVGLSNITIKSSDPYMPTLKLYAIADAINIKKFLSEKTHTWRKAEGIKEFDMYNL